MYDPGSKENTNICILGWGGNNRETLKCFYQIAPVIKSCLWASGSLNIFLTSSYPATALKLLKITEILFLEIEFALYFNGFELATRELVIFFKNFRMIYDSPRWHWKFYNCRELQKISFSLVSRRKYPEHTTWRWCMSCSPFTLPNQTIKTIELFCSIFTLTFRTYVT